MEPTGTGKNHLETRSTLVCMAVSTRQDQKSSEMKQLFILLILPLAILACRSSVDTEREPILSHHGTEPPEVHNKPKETIETAEKKDPNGKY